MKARLTAYFFLSLMLVKVCIMPLVYLDYELRHDYIVKNLCINRDKPQLNCDGKCYLAKRMAAAQEKEQQEAEQSFIFKLCETLADPNGLKIAVVPPNPLSVASEKWTSPYHSGLNGRVLTSGIFRPPLAV